MQGDEICQILTARNISSTLFGSNRRKLKIAALIPDESYIILPSFFCSVADHLLKRHFLDPMLDISIERKSGVPRFELGAAG